MEYCFPREEFFGEPTLMPRLHLAVLTTRNETWSLWKQLSKF